MDDRQHLWSVPVRLDEVAETGRHYELEADASTRQAIARSAGILELPQLHAQFDVTLYGRQGLRVVGNVLATVAQTCVVTLEPMTNEVDEPVDLVFVQEAPDSFEPTDDGTVDALTDSDPPEALVNDSIDLGALAIEFLLLGIDPYPRKPDAEFAAPASAGSDGNTGPFAGLAALKQPRGGKE